MAASQTAEADYVDVVLDRRLDDLVGRGEKWTDVDVKAELCERRRYDVGTCVQCIIDASLERKAKQSKQHQTR